MLAEQLDEFLDQEIEQQPEEKRFVIDSAGKADWAIRRIIMHQHKIDEAAQLAKARIQRIKEFQEDIETENQRSIDFFQNLLRPWAEQQLTGKKKSVSLPSGTIGFRSTQTQYFIGGLKVDGENEKLIEFVESTAPDYIRTEKTTNWGDYKKTLKVTDDGKVITQDGEVISFMAALEQPDSISVKERK